MADTSESIGKAKDLYREATKAQVAEQLKTLQAQMDDVKNLTNRFILICSYLLIRNLSRQSITVEETEMVEMAVESGNNGNGTGSGNGNSSGSGNVTGNGGSGQTDFRRNARSGKDRGYNSDCPLGCVIRSSGSRHRLCLR